MTRKASSVLLSVLLVATAASYGATLRLKDGSVVQGEIQSLRNGVYTVSTESLGKLRIDQNRVESINYDNTQSGSSGAGIRAELQQLQRGLAGDTTIMSMIEGLKQDQQLQAILADPAIMRAVQTGDLQALMASQKFMALLNNEKIKAISRQVTGEER